MGNSMCFVQTIPFFYERTTVKNPVLYQLKYVNFKAQRTLFIKY